MFYTLLQPHGAQAVSASVKAWAQALEAWRVAYVKVVEAPMAAAQAMAQGETPRFGAAPTDPADLATLTMAAWTETVKAATAGAHAMVDLGPMRFEANPFGLTGLFTVETPKDAADQAVAATVVSVAVADVHAAPRTAPVAPAPTIADVALAEAPAAKPGKPSAPRKIGVGAPASRPAPAGAEPPDDLTRIKGVGPKVAEALHAAGVTRFAQIAALDAAGAAHLDGMLKSAGRVEREGWIAQARALMATEPT